jgi:DNA-binding IclR family transcriptional regulator
MEGVMTKKRTSILIADALQQASEPMSARQIAEQIDRPLGSVHNAIKRMRGLGLLDTQPTKPLDTRAVNLYTWRTKP